MGGGQQSGLSLTVAGSHSISVLGDLRTPISYYSEHGTPILTCESCPSGMSIESTPDELVWTALPGSEGVHRFSILATAGSRTARAELEVTVTSRSYITVDTTSHEVSPVNNGNCTLVEAVLAANSNAAVDNCPAGNSTETDVIYLPAGTYHSVAPYTANYAYPLVTSNIRFVGAGAENTILQRSNDALTGTRGSTAPLFHLLQSSTGTVEISGIQISGGAVGLVILGAGAKLNRIKVANSVEDVTYYGGGLIMSGTSDGAIYRSTFAQNTGNCWGGGANIMSSTVIIESSNFSNNLTTGACGAGGGLHMDFGAVMTIKYSSFTGNSAGWTWAVSIAGTSTMTMQDSNISENVNGLLLIGSGAKLIERTTIRSNSWAALNSTDYTGVGSTITFRDVIIENHTLGGLMEQTGGVVVLEDAQFINNSTSALQVRLSDIRITRGSMQGSSGVPAFDLLTNASVAGVTVNDVGDTDTGASGLLNFPVLESAVVSNSNLVVQGYVAAGANVQLYFSDSNFSSWGQGKTFLYTFDEGSSSDLDSSTGSYGPNVAGSTVGSDNASRFLVRIPIASLPAEVTGQSLTALATLSGRTSEFSNLVPITP